MFAAGEKQGYLAAFTGGYNAARKHACPLSEFLARADRTLAQGQHPHGSIVVVQHFALGGLADQFFQGGLYPLRRFRHDLALGGGRQRDPQASLQPLQPIPGKSAAIAEQRHHTRRRRIILLGPHPLGNRGGEHFTAEIASQFL